MVTLHGPIIIPSLVNESYLVELRRRFGPNSNCWSWMSNTCYEDMTEMTLPPDDMRINEAGCLSTNIMNRQHDRLLQEHFDFMMHMAFNIEGRVDRTIRSMDRIKVNLYLPETMEGYNENVIYTPHQDNSLTGDNWYTALVNYSEEEGVAPTYLYNQTQTPEGKLKMEVAHKIYLNTGDCVVFPSCWFHSSSHCDKYRQNVNLIFHTGDESWENVLR